MGAGKNLLARSNDDIRKCLLRLRSGDSKQDIVIYAVDQKSSEQNDE